MKQNVRIFTSHGPLVFIAQNKQSVNISLPHVGRHVFFQDMAANDVSKTTHIYSSKSADQLISARRQQGIYTQRNIKTDKQEART